MTGVVSVEDMIGINPASLYAFSSLYAKFQMRSSVALTAGSYIYLDLPIQFDNLNTIALNSILDFGGSLYSSTTEVANRRIQLPLTVNVTAAMTGWEFYPAGTYTLTIYGVGISNTISQSMTLYLYDSTVEYVIESGVRLLMTTVASLHTISLS